MQAAPEQNVSSESRSILRLLGKHWLLSGLLVTSLLAFGWPEAAGFDPFRLPPIGLRMLVILTMFCLGMSLRREELSDLAERPFAVLLGVLVQTTWMPFLAWLAVLFLQLEGGLAQGVILVGCVPGAMASNVLTMTARGNVSYSISLTTVATLLSPISVPVALYLVGGIAGKQVALDPVQQSWVLMGTVVLPVLAGFLLREFWQVIDGPARKIAPWVAGVALLWIIASVVAGNRSRLTQIQPTMLYALMLINVLGYLGGYGVAKRAQLPLPMARALSLEVGMQNAGLGTYLAALLFGSESSAQIPTAAYTFGCMLTGTILASFWSARQRLEVDRRLGDDSLGGNG